MPGDELTEEAKNMLEFVNNISQMDSTKEVGEQLNAEVNKFKI